MQLKLIGTKEEIKILKALFKKCRKEHGFSNGMILYVATYAYQGMCTKYTPPSIRWSIKNDDRFLDEISKNIGEIEKERIGRRINENTN